MSNLKSVGELNNLHNEVYMRLPKGEVRKWFMAEIARIRNGLYTALYSPCACEGLRISEAARSDILRRFRLDFAGYFESDTHICPEEVDRWLAAFLTREESDDT